MIVPLQPVTGIRVLRRTWAVVSDQGWNPEHHLIGQLTECELDGIIFWVRESVDKRSRFNVSSNERRGEKCKGPSRSRQALELCCPEGHWDMIARLVHHADMLKRPVLRNRRFTRRWIDRQWNNGPLG
jgi:hypothetical protein